MNERVKNKENYDKTAEPTTQEMAEYLDFFEEDKLENDDSENDDSSVLERDGLPDEYSIDIEEASWTDEEAGVQSVKIEIQIDDAEEGWVGEDDPNPAIEEDWFVDEKPDGEEDDFGAEGPIEDETFDLSSQPLETEEIVEPGESIETAMSRLGLSISSDSLDEFEPVLELEPTVLLENSFLGPLQDNAIEVAAFVADLPVAVGDGVFVLGADGMLHAANHSDMISRATSVCVRNTNNSQTIFVATSEAGAFSSNDFGQSFLPINSWFTRDLGDRGAKVSTSFSIEGQDVPGIGFRLLGRTGEGQLYVGNATGSHWRGPVTDGRCMASCGTAGKIDVLALVSSVSDGVRLLKSADFDIWEELELPDAVIKNAAKYSTSMAASADTILISMDAPEIPLFCSLDGGHSWNRVNSLIGVTAIALDPENPAWIAAATHQANGDFGIVRVSDNGGHSWKIALVTGVGSDDEYAMSADYLPTGGGRVSSLKVVSTGKTRRILSVTKRGLYVTTLACEIARH